jgi:hypothetical protein
VPRKQLLQIDKVPTALFSFIATDYFFNRLLILGVAGGIAALVALNVGKKPQMNKFANQTQQQACSGIKDSTHCSTLGCPLDPRECIAVDDKVGCCK